MTFDEQTASSLDQEVDQQEYEDHNMYLRGIKFFGGEEVVCGVREDDTDWTMRKHIVLFDPMTYDAFGNFQPWARTSVESGHTIQTANILSMFEVTDKIATKYDDAGVKFNLAVLREELRDPELTDEEREAIEREIFELTDFDEPIQIPEVPEMYRFLEVPRTIQ